MTAVRTCLAAHYRKPFARPSIAAALACAFLATGAHAQNANGFTLLGNLGGTGSEAVGVSADGAVVVGNTFTTGFMGAPAAGHAFRWTSAGTIDLGNI